MSDQVDCARSGCKVGCARSGREIGCFAHRPKQGCAQMHPGHWKVSQFDATLGYPGEGPNQPFRIQSANVTAWNSWVQAYRSGEFRDSDIILIQDHKLNDKDIRGAQELIKGWGFRSEFGPATSGRGGGNSSGVAIAWRTHLQVRQAGQGIPGTQDSKHRLVWVDYDLAGVYTRIYAIYGDDKNPGDTQRIIVEAITAAETLGIPFVIMGDFNISVYDVRAWVRSVHGTAIAIDFGPTCYTGEEATSIDFAVVAQSVALRYSARGQHP